MWLFLLRAAIALPLAAFCAFVGWHKAFSPLYVLAQNHAWTVWIPQWQGRIVGWIEMASALALVVPIFFQRWQKAQFWAAIILMLLQVAAAVAHAANDEADALWQNGLFIVILAIIAFGSRAKPIIKEN